MCCCFYAKNEGLLYTINLCEKCNNYHLTAPSADPPRPLIMKSETGRFVCSQDTSSIPTCARRYEKDKEGRNVVPPHDGPIQTSVAMPQSIPERGWFR